MPFTTSKQGQRPLRSSVRVNEFSGPTIQVGGTCTRFLIQKDTIRWQHQCPSLCLWRKLRAESYNAAHIEGVMAAVLAGGQVRTYDMGGDPSTLDIAHAIAGKL